jgi:hypothetical protein
MKTISLTEIELSVPKFCKLYVSGTVLGAFQIFLMGSMLSHSHFTNEIKM